ncbi:MAG: hypothetical protein GTO02_00690 [Candidatus Dadabacteria bacterium]|nr:hypothetical protein [Candidatus Dadabacteria bacterium]
MSAKRKEKRKHKRYNVDSIHGNMLYSADVNIVNISIDGIAIETTRRLNLNKEYTLKIKYKDSNLNLKAIVIWSILSRNETKKSGEILPVYKTGMRFSNVLNKKSDDLLSFIDENRTESIEKRLLGIRFKINKTNDALIDFPYKYSIKRISLSGMLRQNSYSI